MTARVTLSVVPKLGGWMTVPTEVGLAPGDIPQCRLLLDEALHSQASGCWGKDEMRHRPFHVSLIEEAPYITFCSYDL